MDSGHSSTVRNAVLYNKTVILKRKITPMYSTGRKAAYITTYCPPCSDSESAPDLIRALTINRHGVVGERGTFILTTSSLIVCTYTCVNYKWLAVYSQFIAEHVRMGMARLISRSDISSVGKSLILSIRQVYISRLSEFCLFPCYA